MNISTFDELKQIVKSPGKIKPPENLWRWPSLTDRVTINGRTGSGKTVAGAWLLSAARFDLQPFIIINYKGEGLFNAIDRKIDLDLKSGLPDEPGLYHIGENVLGDTDPDDVEDWLRQVWRKGNTGLFVDEGYLLPDKKAFRAILTTGRSRHIPVYTLSQRPVKLPRFTISETDFYMAFHLNDRRDRKIVSEFTPETGIWEDTDRRLGKYHSRWYDVGQDFSCILRPVPDIPEILKVFDRRLTPRQKLM